MFFHPLEDIYVVRNHTDASPLFPLRKDFYIAHEYISALCFFSYSEKLWYLSRAYFESLSLLFFNNIPLTFSYIEKNYKKQYHFFYELCKLCKLYDHFMKNPKSLEMLQS